MIGLLRNRFYSYKRGFSLVEVMLLLAIVSLITAGSMSVITKRHFKMPKRVPHGSYSCYYKEIDGEDVLWEERWVNNTKVYDDRAEGGKCNFVPPDKATYFYVQMIGGGGAGGAVAENYTVARGSETQSGSLSLDPWAVTSDNLSNNIINLTEEQFLSLVSGDTVWACNVAPNGSNGKGILYVNHTEDSKICYIRNTKNESENIYTDGTGQTYCKSFTEGITSKNDCLDILSTNPNYPDSDYAADFSQSVALSKKEEFGGIGGHGARGCTNPISVTLNMSAVAPKTPSDGYYYASVSNSYGAQSVVKLTSGTNGEDASCEIGSEQFTSEGKTYCWHDTDPQYTEHSDNVIPGKDGSDGTCSGDCADNSSGVVGIKSSLGKKYEFKYSIEQKSLNYGASGMPGEYKSTFVRSFDKNVSINIDPGQGGKINNGSSGFNGGSTSFGALLVSGGKGGVGNQTLPKENLPEYIEGMDFVHNSLDDNIKAQAKKPSYVKVGDISGIDNSSDYGFDFSRFGGSGRGGYVVDNCWVGTHKRTLNNSITPGSNIFEQSSSTCFDNSFEIVPPENGKSGAVFITW